MDFEIVWNRTDTEICGNAHHYFRRRAVEGLRRPYDKIFGCIHMQFIKTETPTDFSIHSYVVLRFTSPGTHIWLITARTLDIHQVYSINYQIAPIHQITIHPPRGLIVQTDSHSCSQTLLCIISEDSQLT